MGFLNNLITERDNKTHCPVRVGTFLTAFIYHAGAFWMVLGQHAAVDIHLLGEYIQHMSLLTAVGATGTGMKSMLGSDAGPR